MFESRRARFEYAEDCPRRRTLAVGSWKVTSAAQLPQPLGHLHTLTLVQLLDADVIEPLVRCPGRMAARKTVVGISPDQEA